ncbi:YCII-related protein, putative [Actinoplanes sp. N902-109]|nr:YCII-related protein, putative [Actinoplanes sp. N902-109]
MVHCLDAPGTLELRAQHRPAHSAHLTQGPVRPVLVGPLLAGDGITPLGSLLVFAAADRGAVERWVAEDPFTIAGVWHQVRIDAFIPSAKTPVAEPV